MGYDRNRLLSLWAAECNEADRIYATAYNPRRDNISDTSLLVRYLRTVFVIERW